MAVLPALGKLRQEDHRLVTDLGCLVRLSQTKQNQANGESSAVSRISMEKKRAY